MKPESWHWADASAKNREEKGTRSGKCHAPLGMSYYLPSKQAEIPASFKKSHCTASDFVHFLSTNTKLFSYPLFSPLGENVFHCRYLPSCCGTLRVKSFNLLKRVSDIMPGKGERQGST